MNTQPKALILANILEQRIPSITCLEEAATELRRLHTLNQELVEALEYHQEQTRPIQKTIDALASARRKE